MTYTTKNRIENSFEGQVTLDTDYADQLIEEQESIIDSYANKSYTKTTLTDYEYIHLNKSSNIIRLEHSPIISVEELQINKNNAFDPEWESLIEEEDFFLKNNYIIKTKNKYVGDKAMRVKYTYGYETVPKVIETLATKLCHHGVIQKIGSVKSVEGDGDVSLGTISISNNFRYTIMMKEKLKQDINDLMNHLFGVEGYLS